MKDWQVLKIENVPTVILCVPGKDNEENCFAFEVSEQFYKEIKKLV